MMMLDVGCWMLYVDDLCKIEQLLFFGFGVTFPGLSKEKSFLRCAFVYLLFIFLYYFVLFLIPFERQNNMNVKEYICTQKFICTYMLSRTTALYCKCVKQKNGNIPLKNIIAYIFLFLFFYYYYFYVPSRSVHCLSLPSFISFYSCLLFFFLDFKVSKKKNHHHHHYKILLSGCPTKDINVYINFLMDQAK